MPFIIRELGKDISSLIWKRLNSLDRFMVVASNKYTDEEFVNKYKQSKKFIDETAINGYLELLKWAKKNDFSHDPNDLWYYIFAAVKGHLGILKLGIEEDGRLNESWQKRIIIYAASYGQLEILKWLKEKEREKNVQDLWDRYACINAVKGGHLEVLKWLRENGCPWDEDVCTYSAEKGHLEILKWARENGCPWNEDVCSFAAYEGHLEILKWARENGCPWNEETCADAAGGGHLKILKWARENGCPWDYSTYESLLNNMDSIDTETYTELINWLNENRDF